MKKYLIAPGPTPVPEEVLLEMARPILHHRTSEFSAYFAEVRKGLKKIFNTKQDVLILLSSGTAAMEASITNTLCKGDKILVIDGGKFAARWGEIGKAYGLNVQKIKLEWGRSVDPKEVAAFLDKNPDTRAVFVQGSETSTTVYHPIKELGEVIKKYPNTILVVDGITSLGVHDTKMDDWGIDILVTGSQKAFMLPPGLAFIALSEKAWKMTESSDLPKFYLDLKIEKKNQSKDTTAWTPGISLILGLRKVLEILEKEGMENVIKRHAICAEATRAAAKALGLKLLAQDYPSNAATGCFLPEGLDGEAFVNYLREKVGVTVAEGQDHLKGKIVRISHLGYHGYFDTIIAISAIEMGLKRFGCDVTLGKGVAACEEVFAKHLPPVK